MEQNREGEESIKEMFELNPDALGYKFEDIIKKYYMIYGGNLHDDSSDEAINLAAEGIAYLNSQIKLLRRGEKEAGMPLLEERGAIIIDHLRNLYESVLQYR